MMPPGLIVCPATASRDTAANTPVTPVTRAVPCPCNKRAPSVTAMLTPAPSYSLIGSGKLFLVTVTNTRGSSRGSVQRRVLARKSTRPNDRPGSCFMRNKPSELNIVSCSPAPNHCRQGLVLARVQSRRRPLIVPSRHGQCSAVALVAVRVRVHFPLRIGPCPGSNVHVRVPTRIPCRPMMDLSIVVHAAVFAILLAALRP